MRSRNATQAHIIVLTAGWTQRAKPDFNSIAVAGFRMRLHPAAKAHTIVLHRGWAKDGLQHQQAEHCNTPDHWGGRRYQQRETSPQAESHGNLLHFHMPLLNSGRFLRQDVSKPRGLCKWSWIHFSF